MMKTKNKFFSCALIAVTAFFVSPCDDIILTSVFGGAVFGFGTIPFYAVMVASIIVSIGLWRYKKHIKTTRIKFKPQKALSKIQQFKELNA
jgi:hypothetical protein